jgi:hypothetical protein
MEKRSSPPKKLKIKGQPHKLAYINDVEEGLLRARGGSGEMVHGIPAFYDEGDDYTGQGGNDSTNDFGLSDDYGNDGNAQENIDNQIEQANSIRQAQQNLKDSLASERAQKAAANQRMVNSFQNPYANSGLTPQDRAFNVTPNAVRVAQSYMNSLGSNRKSIFAPSVFSSKRIGGDLFGGLKKGSLNTMLGVPSYSSFFAPNTPERKAFADLALEQMKTDNRLENAGNVPSPIGAMIGGYNVKSMMEDLENGGRPALDANGRVQGVFSEGVFGETYQGNPIDGLEETGWSPDDDQRNEMDEVRPVNPLTGQCEEGYFFDEDLQACRMGSETIDDTVVGQPVIDDGAYYRPTGLEAGSAFTPAGFDYDAANRAFLDSYAYRPENYQDPMSLTGFKQIT